MNIQTPFLILSAEVEILSRHDNVIRTESLRAALNAIEPLDFVQVTGVWHGIKEAAFLCLLPSGDSGPVYDRLVALAQFYDQYSILYVDANRVAYEEAVNGNPLDGAIVGRWVALDVPGADLPDSYTIGPDGRHYGTVPL